jgi:hypothetical protein
MDSADIARIVVFSIYLAVCVPWCLYAAWRWHKNSRLPAIKERYPTISLIAFLIYPLGTISLALGRILDSFPCFVLIWQDFIITYVTVLVYLFRAFIYYYKYEWVHERLQYFEKSKEGNKDGTQTSTFFHRHRYLMKKEVLTRLFLAIVSIEAIVPLVYSILKINTFRTQETGSNCDSDGWIYIVYVGFAINLAFIFILALKIRPARDLYNVRSDLQLGMYVVLGIYVLYGAAVFSGQFGISKRFPISSLFAAVCCVLLSYIGAWRPVQLQFQAETGNEDSENGDVSSVTNTTSRGTLRLTAGEFKGSIYNSKQCQTLAHFLSDPVCRGEFQNYVMSAYAIENLLFFDAAAEFHLKWSGSQVSSPFDSQDCRKEVIHHALKIYKEYFHKDAVLVVNVSHQCKLKFKDQFDAALVLDKKTGELSYGAVKFSNEDLVKIFDKSFAEVLGMLHDDLFLKFKRTPQYASCSAGILTQFPVIDEKNQ